jgi:hypothetical protein
MGKTSTSHILTEKRIVALMRSIGKNLTAFYHLVRA